MTTTNFNGTPKYILGTIDHQTLSASIRLNYTLNPNLSIQYYGQPFVSRGRYKDFKYVTDATAKNLYDRLYQYNPQEIHYDTETNSYQIDENTDLTTDYSITNPGFSFVQFRSNLVVR